MIATAVSGEGEHSSQGEFPPEASVEKSLIHDNLNQIHFYGPRVLLLLLCFW